MIISYFLIVIVVRWLFTLLQLIDWLRILNFLLISSLFNICLLGIRSAFYLVELLLWLISTICIYRWGIVGVIYLTKVLQLIWGQIKFGYLIDKRLLV